jgi:hypothetical protein
MQRVNDGYVMPGNGLDAVPTHMQIRPHERPDAVWPRVPIRLAVGDGAPEPFTAEPPDWTEQARCVGRWDVFDEPTAQQYERIVKPTCGACPVRGTCLGAALAVEVNDDGSPLSVKLRQGIWGGLRPGGRAKLQVSRPARCGKGHSMVGKGGAYWDKRGSRWRCGQCDREGKQQRRAAAAAGNEVAA